jgi:hypothetical protein
MLRRLQDHPRFLEAAYLATERLLRPLLRGVRQGGWADRVVIAAERLGKGPLFDCRMCGQCVLHSSGMTCPMSCPKNLRNGPCGGVRPDGHCEIIPEMACVWVQAWERSKRMSGARSGLSELLPPLDRRLEGTSAWLNHFSGAALHPPAGWRR